MSSSRFVLKFWLHIDLCRVIFYCTVSFKGPLHCLEILVCTYLTRKLFSCVSACYSNLQVIGIAQSVFETRPKHAMVRSSSYGRFSLPRFRNLAPNLPSFRILSLWAKLTLFSSRRTAVVVRLGLVPAFRTTHVAGAIEASCMTSNPLHGIPPFVLHFVRRRCFLRRAVHLVSDISLCKCPPPQCGIVMLYPIRTFKASKDPSSQQELLYSRRHFHSLTYSTFCN